MGYRCFAAGDSHNDIQMFEIADKGFFINAPMKISSLHPEIDSFDSYNDLEEAILKYSIYVDHEWKVQIRKLYTTWTSVTQ